ncbi:MAG: phosphatase PAP2 family protein [Pseudomonadota bacterium]
MTQLSTPKLASLKLAWGKLRPAPVPYHRPPPIWTRQETVLALGVVVASVLMVFILDETVHLMGVETPPGQLALFGFLTHAGLSEWTLVPSGVLFLAVLGGLALGGSLWSGAIFHARHAAFIFFTGAGAGITCNLFKNLIGRARPYLYDEHGVMAFDPLSFGSSWWQSWPSGHTTTVAAFCCWVAFQFPATRWPMVATVALLGLTRVFVGAHYVSDVLAGAVLGYLFTLVCARWCANRGILFRRDPDNAWAMLPARGEAG